MRLMLRVKKLATTLIGISLLAGCLNAEQQKVTETQVAPAQALVSISSSAREGQMQIVAIDDIPLGDAPSQLVDIGSHKISVACKLNNGISTTFSFNVELIKHHSYCFMPRNPGDSCTIVYAQVPWREGRVVGC